MNCRTCGHELDAQGICATCAGNMPAGVVSSPSGDPFPPAAQTVKKSNPLLVFFCAILSAGFTLLVLGMNYLRAMHWAGEMNAESFGYMMGGVLLGFALGFVAVFLVRKMHRRPITRALRALGVTGIAVAISFFALAGEFIASPNVSQQAANERIGELTKEAAGTKPISHNKFWSDGPTRDFFREILQMNQQYAAEVKALDSSAIKDLYSAESYNGKPHMEKVLGQLQAALAVDEKYGSSEPMMKRMEEVVASARASSTQKQAFLKGMKQTFGQSTAPRDELLRVERIWMKGTIDLYEFTIAHSSEYSVKGKKLYFRSDAARDEFNSRQSEAIAQHKDFLKAKDAFEQSRTSKLGKVGLSRSDFTPAQLGKPQ